MGAWIGTVVTDYSCGGKYVSVLLGVQDAYFAQTEEETKGIPRAVFESASGIRNFAAQMRDLWKNGAYESGTAVPLLQQVYR